VDISVLCNVGAEVYCVKARLKGEFLRADRRVQYLLRPRLLGLWLCVTRPSSLCRWYTSFIGSNHHRLKVPQRGWAPTF